jgi:hypothetical protein
MVKIVKQFATEDKFHFKLEEKFNLTTTTISLRLFYVGFFQNKRISDRRELILLYVGFSLLKGRPSEVRPIL